MMTGRRVSWARISARISMPSRPGRARSSRIKSKGCSPMRCRPASPVGAVSTAKPSISSRVCKDSRISASSSMMSTAPAMPGVLFIGGREMTAVSDIFRLWSCLAAQGKIQSEGGSCARLAFYANFARMLLDDAIGDRKPKAGAARLTLARRSFRGEKRVVNTLDMLGRNARSGIRDAHAHALSVQRGHTQRTAAGHGVFGIQKQIQEHLLQSPGISLNVGQGGRGRVLHFDLAHLELVLQQRQSVGNHFVHIHITDFGAAGA